MLRRLAGASAVWLLAGVPAWAQSSFTNFSIYVALGDSLTAGVESGSLVRTHQQYSFPALVARAAGATSFEQPLVSEPGIPPETVLLSLFPSPVLVPKASLPGTPDNLALPRPYNNLGVPGATSVDLLTRTSDGGGSHDLVLRGLGTALNQALALRPTALTLAIGNNDVLGAVVRGRAVDGVTLTPASVFRTAYQQIMTALKSTGAPILAANLPDVTTIPFVTTISRFVTNPSTGQAVLVNGQPVPLLGPNGPISEGSYVLLTASSLLAQGIGIPAALGGRGTALPDEVVLDATEVAVIRDRVNVNNQAIRDICGAAQVPIVDFNAFLNQAATTGIAVGGIRITAAFLSGGLFSYDGVHPSDLGYALIANEWIAAMNALGGKIEPIDLGPFLGVLPKSRLAPSAALPEFSLEAAAALYELFPEIGRP